eukprot:gnl/MRDRNA2_/MRDRNA2_129932_c0_seq1.p1 gnl/MRDRNA2_/MRDRNA2_129932_c0~~gnl/MRDRNA2_/MRDRNA2_129932_c0_seq1.p1  ORF type:complete len:305 (-),score=69.04 gnl/MRDRNA2_/MRDRNA2_129932_c0_seq1:50-964(-)
MPANFKAPARTRSASGKRPASASRGGTATGKAASKAAPKAVASSSKAVPQDNVPKVTADTPLSPEEMIACAFHATRVGDRKSLENLIRRGLRIAITRDGRGATLLGEAAYHNQDGIMDLLLEKHMDVNTVDRQGWTALDWAEVWERDRTLRRLQRSQPTAHHGLLRAAKLSDCAAVTYWLEERGMDVNWKGPDGETALHAASQCGQLDVINLLLRFGADPLQKREDGDRMAIDDALRSGQWEAAKILKEKTERTQMSEESCSEEGSWVLMWQAEFAEMMRCGEQPPPIDRSLTVAQVLSVPVIG